MKIFDLNGTWRMTGNGYDTEGTIPGSVYSFLINSGLAPDPFYRDNEKLFFELAEHTYTFERRFTYQKPDCKVILKCDGLDTLCDIFLNSQHVACTNNMHICHEFDVTDLLTEGENHLRLVFHPVNPYIKAKHQENPLPAGWYSLVGYSHLRKMHCMLGWDWGAALPDAGIWRNICLVEKNSPRLTDVKIHQRHCDGKVFVTPHVTTDGSADIRITVTAPTGKQFPLTANAENAIDSPMLWWPNGLGDPNLYTMDIEVLSGGQVVDRKRQRIGLRTFRLVREKDQWGECFYHEVNGVPYFAMGANYIPEDNILSRISKERTYTLLKHCRDCNFNTIRVWGGGYYPDDHFFDACDELGLAVCMDMMFACATYDPDEEMHRSILTEVAQNTARIRDHACLALLCGNNEVEMMMADPKKNWATPHLRDVYLDLFEDAIPKLLGNIAPETPYIPSSPSSGGNFMDPNDENRGNQHYYGVWNSRLPATEYRKKYFRYLSEFGFQSLPDYKTIKQFTREEDRNLNSRVMDIHQRVRGGNGKILTYLADNFKLPSDFPTLIYASQVLQADTVRIGVEHFRRNRGRCMGTLFWQLNDIWPGTSWSGIDYHGRYKALQYCAKRFFAPVMISCLEEGETDGRPHVQCEHGYYDYRTTATLCVNNETREPVTGTVKWTLRDNRSTILQEGQESITVPPMSKFALETIDFHKTSLANHLEFSFCIDGVAVSQGSAVFTPYKHYPWIDPQLTVSLDGTEIVVKSQSYAKYVEVYSEDSDFVLSDNFFDMEAGEKRLQIICGDPTGLKVRSVYDIQ